MESTEIKDFLESDIFQKGLFDADSLIHLIKNKSKISILYGETYDSFGLTLDSVKYYLCLEYLTRLIKKINPNTNATLLIGDTASIINAGVYNKDEILHKIDKNCALIEQLESRYNFSFDIKIMSDVQNFEIFAKSLKKAKNHYENNPEIQEQLKATVLGNRLKQELESGFKYALEEIAIISDYDIKIGPPRERFYDNVSQQINNGKPFGIYLKPTFPLGFNYDFFINNPEIEEFGITPYKAGSNKLQSNRIILNKTTKEELKKLIDASFVPEFDDLPNPVKDLFNIATLSEVVRNKKSTLNIATQPAKNDIYKLLIKEFHEYLQ